MADLPGVAADAGEVLATLRRRGLWLGSVESLTGGMFAEEVTAVPGASKAFVGGFVTYASRLKHDLVGVDRGLIERLGVVNADTAEAMARGGRERLGADLVVACTGAAGPEPQDGQQPGTVFIAVAHDRGVDVRRLSLSGDRQAVRRQTVAAMLGLVAEALA